jgi:hypothetical protein
LAAKHFSLTRKDLIELSIVSVDAIFAGNEEKERLRQILKEFESSI